MKIDTSNPVETQYLWALLVLIVPYNRLEFQNSNIV